MKELICALGALGLAVVIGLVIYNAPSQRRERARLQQSDGGFTLIELLVVVVIIGILVAIAIPLYLHYKQLAADKRAKQDLRAAVATYEQCYRANGRTYPVTPVTRHTSSFTLHCGQNGHLQPYTVVLSKHTVLEVTATSKTLRLQAASTEGTAGGKHALDGFRAQTTTLHH